MGHELGALQTKLAEISPTARPGCRQCVVMIPVKFLGARTFSQRADGEPLGQRLREGL